MNTKLKSALNSKLLALLVLAVMPWVERPAGAQTPTFAITNDSSGVTVYWPVAEAADVLQWTPSLAPINWDTFPAPPSISADQNSLFVLLDPFFQATNPYAFFRLASNSVVALGPPAPVTTPDIYTCNLNKFMNGTVQPNGLDTTWWFQWGQVGPPDTSTATDVVTGINRDPVDVTVVITGLAPGTAYHYQLYASNADGIASGGDNVFQTVALPGAVTSGAGNVLSTSALLLGTANPENSPDGLVGHFQWGLTTSYGSNTPSFFDAAPNAIDATESYLLTGLQPNTHYHYRIVAINCSGQNVGSDAEFVTSAPFQQQPPSVMTQPATSFGTNCVTLNATINPNGASTGYDFQYGLLNMGYPNVTSTGPALTGNSAIPVNMTICGLLPNTTYQYQIVAGNSGGTTTGNGATFTTLGGTPGCPVPSVMSQPAAQMQPNYADFVADINANGVDTHAYFRWGTTTNYGSYAPPVAAATDIGSGTTNYVFVDGNTLAPNTTYHYQAVAFNNCGNTNYGGDIVFTTPPLPPPSVRTLSPSALSATSATMNAIVNPNGATTSYYFYYQSSFGNTTPWAPAGSGTASQPFQAPVTGLSPHTAYICRVLATNSGGMSVGSDVSFNTFPLPPSIILETAYASDGGGYGYFTASVNPNGGSTAVSFDWGTTTNYQFHSSAISYGAGPSDFTATNVWNSFVAGTTYNYRAVAFNPGGTTYGTNHTIYVQQLQ